MHILDDLFLAPSRDKCHRDLDNFIKLCNEVGVPITDEKTVGPATCLQFARINLDTINMRPCLPEDKLARCCGLLTEFYNKRSVTLKEKSFWVGELTIKTPERRHSTLQFQCVFSKITEWSTGGKKLVNTDYKHNTTGRPFSKNRPYTAVLLSFYYAGAGWEYPILVHFFA